MNKTLLTHYFLFDPEGPTCTSHFSDEPMPANRGPFTVMLVTPVTERTEASEHVMQHLAQDVIQELAIVETGYTYNGYMSLDERSAWATEYITARYSDRLSAIETLNTLVSALNKVKAMRLDSEPGATPSKLMAFPSDYDSAMRIIGTGLFLNWLDSDVTYRVEDVSK